MELNDVTGADRIYASNDKVDLVVNAWTKSAEKYAKDVWDLDILCLLAIQKSDPQDREYVLILGNEMVYASKSYEAIAVHIDRVALSMDKVKLT